MPVFRSWMNPPKREESPGYIYLMKPTNSTGVYKIGTAVDVEKRRVQKQKTVDYELETIKQVYVHYNYLVEGRLHDHFSRVRLAGEWFALSDKDIVDFEKTVKKYDR